MKEAETSTRKQINKEERTGTEKEKKKERKRKKTIGRNRAKQLGAKQHRKNELEKNDTKISI